MLNMSLYNSVIVSRRTSLLRPQCKFLYFSLTLVRLQYLCLRVDSCARAPAASILRASTVSARSQLNRQCTSFQTRTCCSEKMKSECRCSDTSIRYVWGFRQQTFRGLHTFFPVVCQNTDTSVKVGFFLHLP